jgi:sugar-specific transcriptional regulator TrmB
LTLLAIFAKIIAVDFKLAEKLDQLGLQNKEAKVYLALLESGQGTVAQLSKTAQINRTTGYDILERLSLYGLASRTVLGKKKIVYAAEPPARFKRYLENRKNLAERNLLEGAELLDELQLVYKTEAKPVIRFFEGREGIKNIYNHTLESKNTIYSILDLSQYLPEFDEFGKQHVKLRVERGVKEKVLVVKNKEGQNFYDTTYRGKKKFQENTEYRWLDKKFTGLPAAEINIYDDIVMGVLFKPKENAAFEIQNESFANSLKMMFDIAWGSAEPLK